MNPSAQNSSLTPSERRALIAVMAVFTARMLGLFMLLPVLALYAASLPGSTPMLAGMAVGAYGISQALLQIPYGWASDRWGRKPLLLFGLMIFALGSVIAALSSSIVGVIVGRILQGAGAISAVLTAYLSDAVAEQKRTRAIAFVGIGIGASFMLSLVIGPLISAVVGVSGLFVVSSLLATIAIIVTLWVMPTHSPTAHYRSETHDSAATILTAIVRNRALWQLNMGIFILHFIIAAIFVALPFVLQDRMDIAADEQWRIFAAILVLSLPGTVLLVRFAERRAAEQPFTFRMQQIAVATILGSLLCLALVTEAWTSRWMSMRASLWWLIANAALFFSAFNFLEARLPARVSAVANKNHRGVALGSYSSCQFLGVFFGGMISGWVFGRWHHSAVLIVCAGLSLTWLLMLIMAKPQTHAVE